MVKEASETFETIQVPVTTEGKIRSQSSEREMYMLEAVCEILNEVKEIKRLVE